MFDKVREHRYKFLLVAPQIVPAIAKRALRHCGKVEPGQKKLPDGLLISIDVRGSSDGLQNSDDAVDGILQLLLRPLGSSTRGEHQERQYNQPEKFDHRYVSEFATCPYGEHDELPHLLVR
jgi:hypothetical protein